MYVSSANAGNQPTNPMKILMHKILQEIADQAYYASHLRRNGVQTTRDRVFAEVLAELEANGDARPGIIRVVAGRPEGGTFYCKES